MSNVKVKNDNVVGNKNDSVVVEYNYKNDNGIININGNLVGNDCGIKYNDVNLKRIGSKAWIRFEEYMKSKTIGEFLKLGGLKADLRYDLNKGFFKFWDNKNNCELKFLK